MECLICGSDRIVMVADFGNYHVNECQKCRLSVVNPLPSKEELDILYNSPEYFKAHMFYDFEKITEADIAALVDKRKALHLADIKKVSINESKRMLEIGTGGGFALKAFEEMGFEVEGVETSAVAAIFGSKRLQLKIHEVSFEQFKTEKQYDLIMLNHVLEHFIDVRSATRKLVSLLAPGGILYVRVPDHDSYDRRIYGKQWPAYAYYHISNFSKASLSLLFRQEGLQVVRTKKFLSEKSPVLVKYLLRKVVPMRWLTSVFSGRTIAILGRKK